MISPLPRLTTALTGRARARPGILGRQVLQVEVCITSHNTFDVERRIPIGARLEWRDATWQDLQAAPGFVLGAPTHQGGAVGTPPTGPSPETPSTGNSNPAPAPVHGWQLS